MTDTASFSYSFSLNDSQKPQQDPTLFAMDLWSETPLPNGAILARNKRNGKQLTLPLEVINAMSYCTHFASLDEHVSELMEGGPAEPEKQVAMRTVIQSLRDGGLTLSARDICDRLEPPETVSRTTAKPILTVITWERPEALERLLDSLLANCDQKGIARCYVVDDSRDIDCIRKNKAITAAMDKRAVVKIEYFGAEEAREWVSDLVRQLPQHEEAIRFVLDRDRWTRHWTCGVSRNFSQMLSVGYPLIVFDDDVICEALEAPVRESGVEFSDRPRQAAFFRTQQDWPTQSGSNRRDPVARHMQCLGLTIPEALRVLGAGKPKQTDLKNASAGFAGWLSAESRILITACGALGDPGTGSNKWVATMPAESRDRLLQDDTALHVALQKRNCWLGRSQYTFVSTANMSPVTGTDNRDFLPPYFPFNRFEDRLFGELTRFIFPDSVSLDQPWVTPHLPIPERSWSERDNNFSITSDFPAQLVYLPERLHRDCLLVQPQQRLRLLAHYFLDLADCPDQKLLGIFADDWHRTRSSDLIDLQKAVQDSGNAPSAWLNYLEQAAQQVKASRLVNLRVSELESSNLDLSGKELLEFWRSAWRSFGQSLLAWPDIREVAREKVRNENRD